MGFIEDGLIGFNIIGDNVDQTMDWVVDYKLMESLNANNDVETNSSSSDDSGTKQNEKPAGNDSSTAADQTPRDVSKKRKRGQDSSEPSHSPGTPICKREKASDTRSGIEGNTGN
ncbi:hypothetical protein SUGI_0709290 [Cryptomeria japonica]|nr:hypothetical protein SUGI_0709290 [Cryptomeria japonica]